MKYLHWLSLEFLARQRSWSIAWAAVLSASLLLAACGGGGNIAGGVGTGGSGVVEGVVSGLGSVIVNGVEYDNSDASMTTDDAQGASSNVNVSVGQRVRLTLTDAATASAVAVLSQLVGPLQSAPDANGEFRALGQTVRLAGSLADKGNNPAAVLAGFGTASPQAGDEVEIHGSWVLDTASQAYVLLASRLEKRSQASGPVLLSGIVQSVGASAGTLWLNAANNTRGTLISTANLSSAQLQGVESGDWVRVWVARADLAKLGTGQSLAALRLNNMALTPSSAGAANGNAASVVLSGPAAAYDANAGTLQIQGKTVKLPAGVTLDTAALAKGAPVQVTLQVRSGADGSAQWTVQSVRQDDTSGSGSGNTTNLGRTTTIKAITSGLDWSGDPVLLRLRGQSISAARNVIAEACLNAATDQRLLVEVQGKTFTGNTLIATQVACSNASGNGSGDSTKTVEQSGTVDSVNAADNGRSGTLVLLLKKGTRLSVTWSTRSYLDPGLGSPTQWVGAKVEIEGVLQNGVLLAQSVRKDD